MAEIKVLEPIKTEIEAFKTAVDLLQTQSALTDVPNMPAAKKYAEQQKKIYELMRLYRQLVEKDAKDMATIVENICRADAEMTSKM